MVFSNQDLLCDSKGGGYLYTKIKYLRAAHKRLSQNASVSESEDPEDSEETASCPEEDVEFLKTTMVNDKTMDIIKSKLAATSEYRRKLIRENHSIDLLENFPYFFTSPQLVRKQFNGKTKYTKTFTSSIVCLILTVNFAITSSFARLNSSSAKFTKKIFQIHFLLLGSHTV